GVAFSFCASPKIHFLASSSLEKSLRMTEPPVNRFPKRTRQYSFPRPLVALPAPTPGGKSLIFAFMAILIRHLYAAVNFYCKNGGLKSSCRGFDSLPSHTFVINDLGGAVAKNVAKQLSCNATEFI